MTNSESVKNKELQAKTQNKGNSGDNARKTLNVRPLPQNRPVADFHTSDTINDMLGYLD